MYLCTNHVTCESIYISDRVTSCFYSKHFDCAFYRKLLKGMRYIINRKVKGALFANAITMDFSKDKSTLK